MVDILLENELQKYSDVASITSGQFQDIQDDFRRKTKAIRQVTDAMQNLRVTP